MRANSNTDMNAPAVHTDMSPAVHPDMDVNVRAAVRDVPTTVPSMTAMTTVAAAVTTAMATAVTTTMAAALGLRRGSGRAQHHNRRTNCGDAIHPGKGANGQRACQQPTRSHDTSPFWNDRVTEPLVAGAHPV
jgi:hypothetical protein